jgi:hypothetical protein
LSYLKLTLKVPSEDIQINKYIEELKNDNSVNKREVSFDDCFFFLKNGLLLQKCKDYLVLFYSENRHFHNRRPLADELDSLIPRQLKKLKLNILADYSYLGIHWNPNTPSSDIFSTSFVSYYSIVNYSDENHVKDRIQIKNTRRVDCIGILPIKFDKSFFLTNFTNSSSSITHKNQGLNKTSDFQNYLKNMIVSLC